MVQTNNHYVSQLVHFTFMFYFQLKFNWNSFFIYLLEDFLKRLRGQSIVAKKLG